MTDLVPIECEARLVGLSKQRRKDGDWTEVRFHIHPDDTPHALFILPLGTDCNLSIKGPEVTTEIADDETPEPATQERRKRDWDELDAREQSVLACKRPDFQRWLCLKNGNEPSEDCAARIVQVYCGVESRSQLPKVGAAQFRWNELWKAFKESVLLDQRDRVT